MLYTLEHRDGHVPQRASRDPPSSRSTGLAHRERREFPCKLNSGQPVLDPSRDISNLSCATCEVESCPSASIDNTIGRYKRTFNEVGSKLGARYTSGDGRPLEAMLMADKLKGRFPQGLPLSMFNWLQREYRRGRRGQGGIYLDVNWRCLF